MRPIDADALLKKCIEGDGDNKFTEGYNFAVQEISAYITFAPAVNRWISVEDALPDALQNVLVCTDINTVTIAWINGNGWTFADTGNGHTEDWPFEAVKYWMNLPEPPKE